MSYENSNGNSYHYTYITNHITANIADSFNTTNDRSHNSAGGGGCCGLVAVVFLVLVFAAFVIGGMMVMEVLI